MTAEISTDSAQMLFSELEPSLTGIAAKLGVSDPAGEARSWYARFADIVSAFNLGKLQREIHRDDGTVEVLPESPTLEQNEAFQKSLKSYLKTAFKHDLIQAFNKRKRFVQIEDPDQELSKASYPTPHSLLISEEEIIRLSDLVGLLEADCNRKRRNVSVARDQVNYLFILATLKFYKQLLHDYGDMPIVRDLHAKDARDFFIFDIREGRTEAIGQILRDLVAQEPARAVQLCSKKLLSPEKGYFTLNRKISRYFNNVLGGMPLRLKKLRLGQADIDGEFDI
jgi:hypothetical protein